MKRTGACAVVLGALALLAGAAGPALAQESTQELPLGGLSIARTPDATLSIDSADIVINPDSVVAKYRITNTGVAPASVTLGFTIPELDYSDPDVSYAIPASDPMNFVGLATKIAGKPGGFAFAQSAVLDGKDISATLRQYKLAMVPVGTFQNQVAALPPEQRAKLEQTGAIAEVGNDAQGNPLYFPKWTVRTAGSKRFVFPPAQPVDIEIRYRTSVGMSLDTPLRLPLRNERGLAPQVQFRRVEYCIDDAFYPGLDKIAALPGPVPAGAPGASGAPLAPTPQEANTNRLRERRMIFALKHLVALGPVKDFRLVVDKGRPDRVVSFCLENLKRISPTAFEMRAVDYTPTRDLKVLTIGKN